MSSLSQIADFPRVHRDRLSRRFGVRTAEAFFEHAVRNPEGVAQGLEISVAELQKLRDLIEPHLDRKFVRQCHQTPPKHPRGVIVE
jgi:hypothetical protein